MKLEELKTLVDYHYWARDRLLAAVDALPAEQFTRRLGGSFPSVQTTLGHLVGAEKIWYSRWRGDPPAPIIPPDTFPDAASVRAAWQELETGVRAHVAGLRQEDLVTVLRYRTVKGEEQVSLFWHTLQHLVNHGSYHRGQVVTMLRQLGATPPQSMDLIAYYRQLSASAQPG